MNDRLKKQLGKSFAMKGLGVVKQILGKQEEEEVVVVTRTLH